MWSVFPQVNQSVYLEVGIQLAIIESYGCAKFARPDTNTSVQVTYDDCFEMVGLVRTFGLSFSTYLLILG